MASGGAFAGMPRTAGSSMLIMGRNEMSRAVTPPDTHDDPVFARMCAMLAPFNARGITITPQTHITTDLEIDSVAVLRLEERRVGTVCVSTCRSRWSPYH